MVLPTAASRTELAESVAKLDSDIGEILRLEVDTMGEDWLLALQAELTKPYFLSVGDVPLQQD